MQNKQISLTNSGALIKGVVQIAQNKFLRYSAAAGIALALCFGAGKCGDFALPSLSVKASASKVVDSGSCGDYVSYVFTDDGVLTISGSGDMWDYSWSMQAGFVNKCAVKNHPKKSNKYQATEMLV